MDNRDEAVLLSCETAEEEAEDRVLDWTEEALEAMDERTDDRRLESTDDRTDERRLDWAEELSGRLVALLERTLD